MIIVGSSLLVLIICCCMDILYICWYTAANREEAMWAAFYSMMIQIVALTSVILAIGDTFLIVPNIIGHGIGSAIGVTIRKKRRKKNEAVG